MLGVEDNVDPIQRGHRGVQTVRLIEKVFQPEPSVGLASDDSLPQCRRVRVEPDQQMVVDAESGEHVGEMRLRLDDFGHDQQSGTGTRVGVAPGPKVLAALRKVRKRKRPRHLVHVDTGMRNPILGERIQQRRQCDGLAGTGWPRQQYSEHAPKSSTHSTRIPDADLGEWGSA